MDRLVPTSASPAPVTGPDYMDAVSEKFGLLFGAAPFILSNIAGTADAITADVDPELSGSVTNGMSFWLPVSANNTGPVTISIDGTTAIDVVDDDGNALASGSLKADRAVLLVAVAGDLRAIGTAGSQKVNNFQTFTASGTWTKPTGTPDDAMVVVEVISGGGGGGNGSGTFDQTSGGGGGGCLIKRFRAGDLSATETITIGAGGSISNAGGTSSFGTLAICYGGGAGASRTSSTNRAATGGGGGGAIRAGGNGQSGGANSGVPVSLSPGVPGDPTAGSGGDADVDSSDNGTMLDGGDGYYGGGGGGGAASGGFSSPTDGGSSVYGGGGGASKGGSTVGGTSVYAGVGGASATAGQAPGGGGGANAAGARGEIRVHVTG